MRCGSKLAVAVNVRQRQQYVSNKLFDCVSELHTQAIEYAQELRPAEVQHKAESCSTTLCFLVQVSFWPQQRQQPTASSIQHHNHTYKPFADTVSSTAAIFSREFNGRIRNLPCPMHNQTSALRNFQLMRNIKRLRLKTNKIIITHTKRTAFFKSSLMLSVNIMTVQHRAMQVRKLHWQCFFVLFSARCMC